MEVRMRRSERYSTFRMILCWSREISNMNDAEVYTDYHSAVLCIRIESLDIYTTIFHEPIPNAPPNNRLLHPKGRPVGPGACTCPSEI